MLWYGVRRMLRMFQEAGPERPTFIDERPRFAGRHWLTSVARQPMMTPQTHVATKPLNGASCWPPEHRPKNKLIEILTAHLPPPRSPFFLVTPFLRLFLSGRSVSLPPQGCEILQQACLSVCLSACLSVYISKLHVHSSRSFLYMLTAAEAGSVFL